MIVDGHKICKACQKPKPVEDFPLGPSRRRDWCSSCSRWRNKGQHTLGRKVGEPIAPPDPSTSRKATYGIWKSEEEITQLLGGARFD